MSSAVLLSVLFFHGAWGTFPPTQNAPPIPSNAVRNLPDIATPVGQFFVSGELSQTSAQTLVKDGGQFPSEAKPEEQRQVTNK